MVGRYEGKSGRKYGEEERSRGRKGEDGRKIRRKDWNKVWKSRKSEEENKRMMER